jgi:hypothetical protein
LLLRQSGEQGKLAVHNLVQQTRGPQRTSPTPPNSTVPSEMHHVTAHLSIPADTDAQRTRIGTISHRWPYRCVRSYVGHCYGMGSVIGPNTPNDMAPTPLRRPPDGRSVTVG